MTRKDHNRTLQNNPQHHEEESPSNSICETQKPGLVVGHFTGFHALH